MRTDNRKRRHSCDSEEDQQQQLSPQAKRSGVSPTLLVSDLDSESSSSDSSNSISSPEGAAAAALVMVTARPCIHGQSHRAAPHSPNPEHSRAMQHRLHGNGGGSSSSSSSSDEPSYDYINSVLREAHFSSLQSRARLGST